MRDGYASLIFLECEYSQKLGNKHTHTCMHTHIPKSQIIKEANEKQHIKLFKTSIDLWG